MQDINPDPESRASSKILEAGEETWSSRRAAVPECQKGKQSKKQSGHLERNYGGSWGHSLGSRHLSG